MEFIKHNKYKLLFSFLLALGTLSTTLHPFVGGSDYKDTEAYIVSLKVFTFSFFFFFIFSVVYTNLFKRLGFFTPVKAKQRFSLTQTVLLWAALISFTLITIFLLYFILTIVLGFFSLSSHNVERLPTSP